MTAKEPGRQLRSTKKRAGKITDSPFLVIPAKAGIQYFLTEKRKNWIPAFAGMTAKEPGRQLRSTKKRAGKITDSPFLVIPAKAGIQFFLDESGRTGSQPSLG
jgi:hypothetical protein